MGNAGLRPIEISLQLARQPPGGFATVEALQGLNSCA